jgi:hypothetical protein
MIRKQPARPPDDATAGPRRTFIIAPVIGAKPDTGVLLGGAGNVAVYHGERSTTHISTTVFGLSVSTKGQVLSNVRFNIFHEGRPLVDCWRQPVQLDVARHLRARHVDDAGR